MHNLLVCQEKNAKQKAFSPPFFKKKKNENTKKEGAKAVLGPGTDNLFLRFHYKKMKKEAKREVQNRKEERMKVAVHVGSMGRGIIILSFLGKNG